MLEQIYYNTTTEIIRSGHANKCYHELNAMERLVVSLFVDTVGEMFGQIACFRFSAKSSAPKVKRAIMQHKCEQTN